MRTDCSWNFEIHYYLCVLLKLNVHFKLIYYLCKQNKEDVISFELSVKEVTESVSPFTSFIHFVMKMTR